MATWMRLMYLRGYAYVLRKANRFYDAMLISWHRDYMFAILGIITGVISFALVGIGLWFFAGMIASFLHGSWADGFQSLLMMIVALATARGFVRLTHWLMPFDDTRDEEDVDETQ